MSGGACKQQEEPQREAAASWCLSGMDAPEGQALGDSFTEAWAGNLADPVVLKISVVEKDTVGSVANHKGGATCRP